MNLDELRAFVAVVETGSMGRASRSLGFARATLRRRIDELEARIGVPLLERSPAGVEPTEAGAVVARQGRRVLQGAANLLALARSTGTDPAGMLHLLVPVGLPPQAVALTLKWLHDQHQGLTFDLRFSPAPLAEVLEGVDVVFFMGPPDASPGATWTTRPLRTAPQRLLASRRYLEEQGEPQSPDELDGHKLLLWQPPGPPRRRLSLDGRLVGSAPVVVSPDIHGLLHMAAAGLGIACVPEGGIAPSTISETLLPVLADCAGPSFQMMLAVPRALADLPKIRAILSAAEMTAQALNDGSEPEPVEDGRA